MFKRLAPSFITWRHHIIVVIIIIDGGAHDDDNDDDDYDNETIINIVHYV